MCLLTLCYANHIEWASRNFKNYQENKVQNKGYQKAGKLCLKLAYANTVIHKMVILLIL